MLYYCCVLTLKYNIQLLGPSYAIASTGKKQSTCILAMALQESMSSFYVCALIQLDQHYQRSLAR